MINLYESNHLSKYNAKIIVTISSEMLESYDGDYRKFFLP